LDRRRLRPLDIHECTGFEMINAGARTAVKCQDRAAIAAWILADLNRTRRASAKHHVAFAHAKRNAAAQQSAAIRRGRCTVGLIRRSRRRRFLHGRRRARSVGRDEIIRGDRPGVISSFLKFRKSVAAFAADEFERLGKPGILVLEIDIGAATERNRQCCDNAKLVSPKPHHGPPAAPTASRMRRFVLPAWQRAYVSGTPRFRR